MIEFGEASNRGKSPAARWVALVAGVRTPFAPAGGALRDFDAVQLAAHVIRALLDRTGLAGGQIHEVIMGSAFPAPEYANPALAAARLAGLPDTVPALAVQRGALSGCEALTVAAERIVAGRGAVYLVVGAESLSNWPLPGTEEGLAWRQELRRSRSQNERSQAWSKLRSSAWRALPPRPLTYMESGCEPAAGLALETLASDFAISRREQEAFALESRRLAAAAGERLAAEIAPLIPPPCQEWLAADQLIGATDTPESLAKETPLFDPVAGTITAGSSAMAADGAVALLVVAEDKARSLDLAPQGYLRAGLTLGVEERQAALAPAAALARLLAGTRFGLGDLDLVEYSEATAAQVLLGVRNLAMPGRFAPTAIGRLDFARLNVNGGALALGHPPAADNLRQVLSLLQELRRRERPVGAVAAGMGDGLGAALLVQRP